MQVISVGTLTKILVNNISHPLPTPPPQGMLSFDDQMHIYTRKTIYLHLSTLHWEGGRGDYAQIVLLKMTTVALNYSSVIFCTFCKVSQLLMTSIVAMLGIYKWPPQAVTFINLNRYFWCCTFCAIKSYITLQSDTWTSCWTASSENLESQEHLSIIYLN